MYLAIAKVVDEREIRDTHAILPHLCNMPFAQMLLAVLMDGDRPTFPHHCPREFAGLASECMADSPLMRPSFVQVGVVWAGDCVALGRVLVGLGWVAGHTGGSGGMRPLELTRLP
jgi:hypothetical protein